MNDDEFRGLQDRVALIKDMAAHPGWSVALDRAQAQMYLKQKKILLGKVDDYQEYRDIVAWMEGLSFFMTLPEVVEKELLVELENREEA